MSKISSKEVWIAKSVSARSMKKRVRRRWQDPVPNPVFTNYTNASKNNHFYTLSFYKELHLFIY